MLFIRLIERGKKRKMTHSCEKKEGLIWEVLRSSTDDSLCCKSCMKPLTLSEIHPNALKKPKQEHRRRR